MSSESKDGLLAVCATLACLSIVAVGLRFYAREQQKLRLLADDWTALAALISYVGAALTFFYMVHIKTLGYAEKDFTPAQLHATAEHNSKAQIVVNIFMITTLAFTKISAVFFYRRIFCSSTTLRWFNLTTSITIVVLGLWWAIFVFLDGFQCGTHFSALWDGNYLKYCTISFPFLYGLAISDFLLDIWILALPIIPIMHLQTSKAKRCSIFSIMLLAFIGLGASIARMVQYVQVENAGREYFINHDKELAETQGGFLSMLEAGMSLLAVNLPSLWLLLTTSIPKRVVSNLRSIFSLSSRTSVHSGRSDRAPITSGIASSAASTGGRKGVVSQVFEIPSEKADSTESFNRKSYVSTRVTSTVIEDLEAQSIEIYSETPKTDTVRPPRLSTPPNGTIMVHNTFAVESNQP